MIKLEIHPLPKESDDKLRAWMEKPELELLKNCVLARIHEQSTLAINATLKKPFAQTDEGGIPLGATKAMAEAAQWKIFLDKLNDISQPGSELNLITSTSYSHASHD